MRTNLPEDLYLSEASHVNSDASQMDADIEESQHLHFNGTQFSGISDSSNSDPRNINANFVDESQDPHLVLSEFHAMMEHTPVWLRAEEAGMAPISPWRQTCDVPPSQRPPPASSRQPLLFGASRSVSPSPQQADYGSPSPSPSPLPVYVVYQQSAPRTPLATLYSRNQYEPEAPWKETADVGCGTTDLDIPSPVPALPHPPLQKSTQDVECQMEPSDEIIPDWMDRSDVEKELRAGRDERLKAYIMRFRHSVAAACVDHRRPFNRSTHFNPLVTPTRSERRGVPESKASAGSPTSGRAGRRLTRVTKSKAKERIKGWYMPAAALDSQADSQMWLENLGNVHIPIPAAGLHSTPTGNINPKSATPDNKKNFFYYRGTTGTPSTPVRASTSRQPTATAGVPTSPFQVWGMDPAVDKSPRRFSKELKKLTVMCGTARTSPRLLSYPDLDALLEYTAKLNALLTEDLVVTHTKLFALEDKLKAYELYFNSD